MHPYSELPARNFWKKFVSHAPWRDLNLNDNPKYTIETTDRVVTAGSCFAQHIARYMKQFGRHPYMVERPHPLMALVGAKTESYDLFSARYGNVYTSRQCLELFRQAVGTMPVIEDFVEEKGRFYDLVRPNAIPDGFSSLAEAAADRRYHISCVNTLFRTADVFIFTLGLTESWYHAKNGHTYPVCPGTVHGTYQPEEHRFYNLTCADISADLDALIAGLKEINPELRIILTVSPVPLVATNTQNNVLLASSYSKSVLRAACGEIEDKHSHVHYFPSYEIINHPASFGQYLESDLRGVTERGVSHVMDCFFKTFCPSANKENVGAAIVVQSKPVAMDLAANMASVNVECDELFNEIIV